MHGTTGWAVRVRELRDPGVLQALGDSRPEAGVSFKQGLWGKGGGPQ